MAARKKTHAAKKKAPARKQKPAPKRKRRRRRRPRGARGRRPGRARVRQLEAASDDQIVEELVGEAGRIRDVLLRGERPEIKTPQRSLENVTLSKEKGYFEIGRKRLVRTLSVNTVRTFAQTLKFMALSKEMVLIDDLASKREVYYQSINWGDARFNDQSESDTVMDDVEAMFSIHAISREQLRFIPEEHGGAVAGNLTVIDRDPETRRGRPRSTAGRLGSGSYTVPSLVGRTALRDQREVHPRRRDGRHVPAPHPPPLVEGDAVDHREPGRRAVARHAALPPPAVRRAQAAGLRVHRLRSRTASPTSTGP